MEICRVSVYLIVSILLTLGVLTKCKARNSNENESGNEHLEFPLGLISDDPDGNVKKVIHTVEVVHHDGGTITKYETTAHMEHDAEEATENGLIYDITQQSNVPNNYKQVTKKTVIKQTNNGGQNSEELSQPMKNAANYQYTSQTGNFVMDNNGVLPSTLFQQTMTGLSGNVEKTMQTISGESSSNDLNKVQSLRAIPSNIDISTMTSSNSNYATTNSLKPKLMVGDGKMNTMTTSRTSTGMIDGDGSGSVSGNKMSRKPKGSFIRKKTTIITDIDKVDDNNRGLNEYNIGHDGGASMSSNNIASTINSLNLNQLTTNSLQPNSMGEDSQMSTASAMSAGGHSGDGSMSTSGVNISQKPGGLLSRKKTTTTTIISDINNVDDSGLNQYNIRYNGGVSMPSNNIATSTINALNSNQLHTNSLLPNSLGGNSQMSTTYAMMAGGRKEYGSMSTSGVNIPQKPGGSFESIKTLTVKQDSNGNNYEENSAHGIGLNNKNKISLNNIIPMKMNPLMNSQFKTINTVVEDNYNNANLQTESMKTRNEMDSSQMAFNLINLPDSFKQVQTATIQGSGNRAEDGLNGQIIKLKFNTNGEMPSLNNNIDYQTTSYNSKDYNNINDNNGYVIAVGNHIPMDDMSPSSSTGGNSCSYCKKKKQKGKKNVRGRGSKIGVRKNSSNKPTRRSTKTRSKKRSTGEKPNCSKCNQNLNKRDSSSSSSSTSSSSSSESNESTTNHGSVPSSTKSDEISLMLTRFMNMYQQFMTTNPRVSMSQLPSSDSNININQPPTFKDQNESNNISNLQEHFTLSSQNSQINQYDSLLPSRPSFDQQFVGQHPLPLPYMSLQNYGKNFPPPELERMSPLPELKKFSPPTLPGFMNTMKLPPNERQQISDVTEITGSGIKNSEFRQIDAMNLGSTKSNTESGKISSSDSNQGMGYIKTITKFEKNGSDNPSEMYVLGLQSMASPNEQLFNQLLQSKTLPPNMSYQDFVKAFQMLDQKKIPPSLPPFLQHLNIPSENGKEINYITGLTQNNRENSELEHLNDLNSEYITTNIQSSTTSNSYSIQDNDNNNMETINKSENKDEHGLQTRSYTTQNVQSYGQYLPAFMNFQNIGGSAYDWKKYLPSFMNQKHDITQNGNEQMNALNSPSMTTDSQNSIDGNQNEKYTKTIETTQKIGGDSSKEMHIVQSQTMNPGNNGFGYSYSYSY